MSHAVTVTTIRSYGALLRHAELAVRPHHADVVVPGRGQHRPRSVGHLRIDVDRGHRAVRPGQLPQQRRVVAAGPDLQHAVARAGSPACSSISATMLGWETELIATPASFRFISTTSSAYAISSGACGTNRCRGTARNAAATRSSRMAPSATRMPGERRAQRLRRRPESLPAAVMALSPVLSPRDSSKVRSSVREPLPLRLPTARPAAGSRSRRGSAVRRRSAAAPPAVSVTRTPRPSVSLRRPGDQAARLQPIQPLGDRAGRHHRRPHQTGRGQAVLGVAAAQRRQHVERRASRGRAAAKLRRSSPSTSRLSRFSRPSTAIGDASRSGRCSPHCSSTRST